MDFGDILNQWQDIQKGNAKKEKAKSLNQVSHKKANAPTKEEKEILSEGYTYEQIMKTESEKKINPMEMWLRRYGTVDKDAVEEKMALSKKMEDREYLREMSPEARLDLHGCTREQALEKLDFFIKDCIKHGLKKVLIIHGKGNHSTGSDPVLGDFVRTYIEEDKRLGASGHPNRNHGGNGATWVILRKK